MRSLGHVPNDSCAAVLSFFALHHVDLEGMRACFVEWYRVLRPGGQLVVATWEGEGTIDYDGHADIVAVRYRKDDVVQAVSVAGYRIDNCSVESVEGIEMDAVYLTATK